MNKIAKISKFAGSVPLLAIIALGVASIFSLASAPVAKAQGLNLSETCRAVMIIDRSGSVGFNGVQTIQNQIQRLFEPTGIDDNMVELAFWTFANDGVFGNGNYNAPFHGYVSSDQPNASFNQQLNSISAGGNTNYQEGFGYKGETRNPALNDIINMTDIVVFMSDGQPNSPNNAQAAGRAAALKHINEGRYLVGGNVGASVQSVMNYTITGDSNNSSRTFAISNNYGDLAAKLKQIISDTCTQLFPPNECEYNPDITEDDPLCVPPAPYTLVPLVTSDNDVISSDDSAGFDYFINNESPSTTSDPVGWSIKRVVVDVNQDECQLYFRPSCGEPLPPADPYRDNYGCDALLGLVSNNGTCEEIARGTSAFPPGNSSLSDSEVGIGGSIIVEDRWPVGTKICYVFSLDKPTEQATPIDRHSPAVCVVIGKRPAVQIYGGDLIVGSMVSGDPEELDDTDSKVQVGLTVKGAPIDRVFGSWTEYAVRSSGSVIGMGSASGLADGYPATSAGLQGLWSKLTFANVADEYGNFTEARTMPDVAAGVLSSNPTVGDITTGSIAFNGSDVASGIYQKLSGDLTLSASMLEKGKSVIVYVPEGTVTIDGNLLYTTEALTSVGEIPSLIIIARNINILSGVAQVDAWLIARNSATSSGGGVINTCFDGPERLSINECNVQLRINGPVMSRTLLLRRTAGSGSGASSSQPAEIINMRADMYLSVLSRQSEITVPVTTYSVELPPRF